MNAPVIEIQISDPETHRDDEVAHIVKREDANAGYIGQVEVEALCGYRWVPSKDPMGKPVCFKCDGIMKRRLNRGSN